MRKHAEIVFFHSIGWFFVVSGIAAGFVPFVPGFVLIIIGIYLMSQRSAWLRGKLDFFRKYYPSFDKVVVTFERVAGKVWHIFLSPFLFVTQRVSRFASRVFKRK